MRAFAEKNFDLIIGVGFAQGPIMKKGAAIILNAVCDRRGV